MTVVVTGVGCSISCGLTPSDIIQGTLVPAVSKSLGDALAAYRYDETVATALIPRKHIRKMDRMGKMVTAAVASAMADAELPGEVHSDEIGLVLDTAFGSAGAVSRVLAGAFEEDPIVSPLLFPNVVANASAGQAAISFGLRGPSSTLGGIGAMMYAFDLIRSGRASCLIVGGCDEITDIYAKALRAEGIAQVASRLGEGAAFIVLERDEAAIARGAHVYAQIEQVSIASDLAFAPHGENAYLGACLDTAADEIVPQNGSIDWLVGAGLLGTGLRDRERALADKLGISNVVWPKERTGEMFACSNALNTVIASVLLCDETYGPHQASTALVCGYDSTRGQGCTALLRRVEPISEGS